MDLARLRNVGVAAHIDAGKTTVSERFLFYSGVERRMGEVHEGTAAMDWMEEERRRGITITAAATTLPWRDHTINLIDTPGHVDFTVEVERSMRVLDGAVLVLNAVGGVQAQTETVWRQMRDHGVPRIAFVNQCDRAGADYFQAVASATRRLGANAVPVQYPIGEGREFRSVVDLLERKMLVFDTDDLGAHPREEPVPAEVADEIEVLRAELVEVLAEDDEELFGMVVEERDPPAKLLRAALRKRVLAGTLLPVLCGAALRNVGIQPLLDAILDLLPSPLDRGAVTARTWTRADGEGEETERPPSADAPLAALIFKLTLDQHEDLAYARVYSGALAPGEKLFNPRVGRMERVTRVLRMHADTRQPLERAVAGEIVALTGLKQSGTGDTLCDRGDPVVLERLTFPEPVITMTVEPASTAERDRLQQALARLTHEDPSFRVREDEETGQWLIEGMGELHLEVVQHRLRDDFRLDAKVGKPRVAYREAARTTARGEARVDRAIGGKEVFGAVEVELVPEDGSAAPTVEWDDGGAIPEALRPVVEEALVLGAQSGPRFGFPLVGARVRVVGGDSDPARDADVAFAQAASSALREALGAATVELLEPVMTFEIQAPDEFMSGIIADLNSHRAEIAEVTADGSDRAVSGTVPLAHMFGYTTTLRSLSQGRADFSLEPAGFRAVPEEELAARGLVWQ